MRIDSARCRICRKELPADSKTSYCSDKCLKYHRKLYARGRKNEMQGLPRTCPDCGKILTDAGRFKEVFCSDACAVSWYANKRDLPIEYDCKCKACGIDYKSQDRNSIYCSVKCKNAKARGAAKRKNTTSKDIADINAKARELHMTYGQYVAMQYCERSHNGR